MGNCTTSNLILNYITHPNIKYTSSNHTIHFTSENSSSTTPDANFLDDYYSIIALHHTLICDTNYQYYNVDNLHKLPSTITHIIFRSIVGHVIINHRIKYLAFEQSNRTIKPFKNLEYLYLNRYHYHQLELTKNLKHLEIVHVHDFPIVSNKYLTHLSIGWGASSHPKNSFIPSKHLEIIIGVNITGSNALVKKLKKLVFEGVLFDRPTHFSKNIKYLSLGNDFNQHITLPKYLTYLYIGVPFNKPIILPKTLVYFSNHSRCSVHVVLEHPLEKFVVVFHSHMSLTENLPHGTKILHSLLCRTHNNLPFATLYEG